MPEENKPSEANPDGHGVSPAEGGENVSGEREDAGIRDTLGKALGREFKTDEDALQSIKELNSYTGKFGKYKDAIEALEKAKGGDEAAASYLKELAGSNDQNATGSDNDATSRIEKLEKQIKLESFYRDNPEYSDYQEILGDNPEEALKNEGVKKTVEAAIAHAKSQNSKSVIHSNARISDSNADYKTDLDEARKTGNWAPFLAKHKGFTFGAEKQG